MMYGKIAAGTAAVLALAVPATAAYASGWNTIAKKSISGAFSITAMTKSANGAHSVRLVSAASRGGAVVDWTLACSHGFTIHSHGGTWNPGVGSHVKTLRTGFSGAASDCDIFVSFGPGIKGGRETVSIQRS